MIRWDNSGWYEGSGQYLLSVNPPIYYPSSYTTVLVGSKQQQAETIGRTLYEFTIGINGTFTVRASGPISAKVIHLGY